MDGAKDRRRGKAKKWFGNNSKKARRAFCLAADQRGFLISCNFKEKEAIREAYQLLDEYADKLYGSENKIPEPNSDEDDDEDIDASLEAEREALKAQASKKEDQRRFQVVETSVKNFLFIRTTLKDPVGLVTSILEDIEQTGVQRVRHLLRMVPIELTCKASEKQIGDTLKIILTPHFENKTDATSYVLIFKLHCHNTITKEVVINIVGNLVKEMNPNALVDYKNPDLSITVDIIKGIACCSVVPKFYQYKKYNLGELANMHNKLKEAAALTAVNDKAENVAPAEDVKENGTNPQLKPEEVQTETEVIDTKPKPEETKAEETSTETIPEKLDTETKTEEIGTETTTDQPDTEMKSVHDEKEQKTDKIDRGTEAKGEELTSKADAEKKENGDMLTPENKDAAETVVQ